MVMRYSHFSKKNKMLNNFNGNNHYWKEKYVVVAQKKFEELQSLAAAKNSPQKKLSLKAGKSHAYKLIEGWAKEK